MVLSFQRVTPIVSHPLTRPDDLGVTYGPNRQTDTRKPHHHRRFSRRCDLLPAAERRQSLRRMCARLPPGPWLPTQAQGDVGGGGVSAPPLALCARPPGWGHHLADTVHDVPRRVHGPAALRLTLSFYATGGGPQGFVSDAWWTQCGVECRHLPYLP